MAIADETLSTDAIGPCFVLWSDHEKNRRFASFDLAERFARRLVSEKAAAPRDVGIYRTDDMLQIATIDMDALDRVWTDIKNPASETLL